MLKANEVLIHSRQPGATHLYQVATRRIVKVVVTEFEGKQKFIKYDGPNGRPEFFDDPELRKAYKSQLVEMEVVH